jgi:hypothetical protein
MSEKKNDQVVAQWVRLGAMFNWRATRPPVDLEKVLLETARDVAGNSRLLILAVTWLVQYGPFVAKHRLAKLIRHDLEPEHRPTMGLMLDFARTKTPANARRFNQAIIACGRAIDHRPLLDIDCRNDFFIRMAKQSASKISRKWGRWIEDFELKTDAIRPATWIIQHNRQMQWRADFKGDLRASILAELEANPRAGDSESELSRACGGTRAAIADALAKLESSGRITRRRERNRVTIALTQRDAA